MKKGHQSGYFHKYTCILYAFKQSLECGLYQGVKLENIDCSLHDKVFEREYFKSIISS